MARYRFTLGNDSVGSSTRGITKTALGVLIFSALIGCSTLPANQHSSNIERTPASSESNSSDKNAEYKALLSQVSKLHEFSEIGDSDKRFFEPNSVDAYQLNFEQLYCEKGTSPQDCARQFDRAAYYKLSEIYFAADLKTVNQTCVNEPLICDDLVSFETLFRKLHNQSVEASKEEKLNRLEDWRQGKISDDELKAALHLDFQFENGKLTVSTPSV